MVKGMGGSGWGQELGGRGYQVHGTAFAYQIHNERRGLAPSVRNVVWCDTRCSRLQGTLAPTCWLTDVRRWRQHSPPA